jgi:8-amino-7-oxononanoate synthase
MSLFDKCGALTRRIESMKQAREFFYLRELTPTAGAVVSMNGRRLINLGSNNYLGLALDPEVVQATARAVEEYGTGTCSSRVLAGTSCLHNRLERKLAAFKGTEDAVVFSTGFAAMMGTVSALTGEGDLVFSDELNHASIVEGCRLSRAEVKVFRHLDLGDLEAKLAGSDPNRNKLIVTDGVFSMTGSIADLPGIKSLAQNHGAALMVDDAHGTGVLGATGKGIVEHYGMEGDIDLVCGTFSKALGTTGGYTATRKEVADFLRLSSRPFIFTASPTPACMATVLASLERMEKDPTLLARLRENARFVKSGLRRIGFRFEDTPTPIIALRIGDDALAFRMAGGLEDEGVIVNPVVPPAVPPGSSLIRISVMASLRREELETALAKLESVGRSLGIV